MHALKNKTRNVAVLSVPESVLVSKVISGTFGHHSSTSMVAFYSPDMTCY